MAQNENNQPNTNNQTANNPNTNSSANARTGNWSKLSEADDEGDTQVLAEIKKTWKNLSDDDIKLYQRQPDKFLNVVSKKEMLSAERVQSVLKSIKTKCANGECGTGSNASSGNKNTGNNTAGNNAGNRSGNTGSAAGNNANRNTGKRLGDDEDAA